MKKLLLQYKSKIFVRELNIKQNKLYRSKYINQRREIPSNYCLGIILNWINLMPIHL